MLPEPVIEKHQGVYVVRDDYITGGTKARYLIHLFDQFDEVVYATPAYGGAQVALAYCAKVKGKQATLFVAKRKRPHRRTLQAKKLGAKIYQVPYGYLNVVQSRARKYSNDMGAFLLPFGGNTEQSIKAIAESANNINKKLGNIDQLWCASGSGVLARGLQKGIKSNEYYSVQVGSDLKGKVGNAKVYKAPYEFSEESKFPTPFPSCPNYDRKAWELCVKHGKGKVLFWNVLG